MISTIFIVEDDEGIRTALEILLRYEGYDVIITASAYEFFQVSGYLTPQIYLIDDRLPDGSGIDLCNIIKRDKRSEVPVIIMSSHAKQIMINKKCHPDALISKPYDLDILLKTVADLISKNNESFK